MKGLVLIGRRTGLGGQDLVVIGSHAVVEVSDSLGVCRQGLAHLGGWAGEGLLLPCRAPLLALQEILLHNIEKTIKT